MMKSAPQRSQGGRGIAAAAVLYRVFNQKKITLAFLFVVACVYQFQYDYEAYYKKEVPKESTRNVEATAIVQPSVLSTRVVEACNSTDTPKGYGIWAALCKAGFVSAMEGIISQHDRFTILQIGAHEGWNQNDPIGQGLGVYFEKLSAGKEKESASYVLVEASPFIFKKLQTNVKEHQYLCNITAVHLGVVPKERQDSRGNLTFYAIKDTINSKSGRDTLSGKQLPYWVTQTSSFNRNTVLKHAGAFSKKGLDINNYISEINVPTATASTLYHRYRPLMVLLDTEGLDCQIVSSWSEEETPHYLIFEINHCEESDLKASIDRLQSFDYITEQFVEDIFAYKNQTAQRRQQR
jgi:hypothetical protein